MTRPIDARESFGEIEIHGAVSLDEALDRADVHIRAFVGDRTFTIWQTRATPVLTVAGDVMAWSVEVAWRVTS